MWCPDVVVVVVVRACVCVWRGGALVGGGVCVSRDTFELQYKHWWPESEIVVLHV